MSNSKYPILSINGKLFPSWIIHNFKEYKIPAQYIDDNNDICNLKKDGVGKKELRNYQIFVSKYLDYNSPYNGILLYHGLGSGKTATSIGIYNNLYKYSRDWNVFIILKAALIKSTWKGKKGDAGELKDWLIDYDNQMKNIVFISYDAPNADTQFFNAVKNADLTKKNLYIIDEAHNFIRNVYGNISNEKGGKKALSIYNYILNERKENYNTKLVLISATPIINQIFELALIFNLLRPNDNLFPTDEATFNDLYVDNDKPLQKNLNMFQRRILGLVSFYESIDRRTYAKKNEIDVEIKMSEYQCDIYKHFWEIENKINEYNDKKKKKKQNKDNSYKTYTRQACNFVFPTYQNISGEQRPRPGQYRISEKESQDILRGNMNNDNTINLDDLKKQKIKEYAKAIQNYINIAIKYFDEMNSLDNDKHNIITDINNIINIFNEKNNIKNNDYLSEKDCKFKMSNIIENYYNENKMSNLLKALYECSVKYVNVIIHTYRSKGPVIIYSNYVTAEGISMIKQYLKYIGFNDYEECKNNEQYNKFRFVEYSGQIDQDKRDEYKNIFNVEKNKYGDIIKVILISVSGTEGISVFSVRQIHVVEPHWNETRIIQMEGRGIRYCSHQFLPLNERVVDVYKYISLIHNNTYPFKETTDQQIKNFAVKRQNIINSFLDVLKSSSIDCELNIEETTKAGHNIKCFKFEEPTIIDNKYNEAYKKNIEDDINYNSGMNASNSLLKNVQVYKIKAVIQKDKEGNKFSDPLDYWININDGYVYDFNLKYLIGQVERNKETELFNQTDDGLFIITKTVFYPEIKYY